MLFLLILLKRKKIEGKVSVSNKGFFGFLSYWKISSKAYKELVIGLLFFTLINSSDVFLLLLIKFIGYTNTEVITVYIFYNFVYALVSYPVGILADKLGLKNIFIFGLIMFAIVWCIHHYQLFFVLFLFYGIYAASKKAFQKLTIKQTGCCYSNRILPSFREFIHYACKCT